jgi:hypothetical protein
VSDPIARLLAVLSLLINLVALVRELPTVTLETVVRGPLTTDRLIIGAGGRLRMEGNLTSQASELRGMVKPDFGDVQQGSSTATAPISWEGARITHVKVIRESDGRCIEGCEWPDHFVISPPRPGDPISGKWGDYYKGTEK